MSLFPPPQELSAELFARLPEELLLHGRKSGWIDANRAGAAVGSFLEGPSFDHDGNLLLVDIPYGRVFRLSPAGEWMLLAEYDGWPNGLKLHRDGRIFIADHRRGIVTLDARTGQVTDVLGHRSSESFKGVNDLFFDARGRLYFTDQGQTGLHDPTGAVYRLDLDSRRLDRLIGNAPSPNGLVTDLKEGMLYVAMTRDNAVWRLPFVGDGVVSKVGRFIQLSGSLGGPDGMALDAEGNLYLAQVGMGSVWAFTPLGEPLYRIRCEHIGLMTTNLAFGGPAGRELYITVSDADAVARVSLPHAGRPMFAQG